TRALGGFGFSRSRRHTRSKRDCGSDVCSSDLEESGDITLVLSNRDEFVSALEAGALKAAEELGVNLITQDAQSDTSKMIQFVERSEERRVGREGGAGGEREVGGGRSGLERAEY